MVFEEHTLVNLILALYTISLSTITNINSLTFKKFNKFQQQEVTVGHLASPCNAIWKSVSSLHNINQLLVDMTAAGINSVNLETAIIR